MTYCASRGGCVSDYIAIGITGFVFLTVLSGICLIVIKRRDLELSNKKFSALLVQAFASLIYLAGVMMSENLLNLPRKHLWDNCYLWMVWLEPLGFGLLLSCHIHRAYRLYYMFIARRLPPLEAYQLMALLLLPWFAASGVMQGLKVMRHRRGCSTAQAWGFGIASLHVVYPSILLFGAWKIRHVRFKFNEYKELIKGAVICGFLLVVSGGVRVVERTRNDQNGRLKVVSRFIIVIVADAFVLLLFWLPLGKPVSEHVRKKPDKYSTMGQALGVPHSGLVTQHSAGFDFNRPLEFLLEDRKFRASFLEFAERRFAGEVVHFYNEVRELSKLHASQVVQRVYLAEHIIDKYIKSGSPMEINVSYHMRMEVLNTRDLADPDLFKRVVNEALRMMQMNLLSGYWQSECFQKLKTDLEADIESQYTDGLDNCLPEDNGVVKTLEDENPFERNVNY